MGKIWATIDRFEEDKAVLILPDKQQLIIVKKFLPKGLKEGDGLEVSFTLNKKESARQKIKAKEILSQLLN